VRAALKDLGSGQPRGAAGRHAAHRRVVAGRPGGRSRSAHATSRLKRLLAGRPQTELAGALELAQAGRHGLLREPRHRATDSRLRRPAGPDPEKGPMMSLFPETIAALAPTGTLRAAINAGNPIPARLDADGEPVGVSVDLARALAEPGWAVGLALSVFDTGVQAESMRVAADHTDIGFLRLTRSVAPPSPSPRPMC